MKLGIFLIILGIALGVERGMLLGTELSAGVVNPATLLTMALYISLPIYFGARRVLNARRAW